MVRVKNRDDLADVEGRLSARFRAANLTYLNDRFFRAAGSAYPEAAATLDQFFRAASRLSHHENAFNRRARPSSGKPSLMTNLRGADQMAAVREFAAAKEAVLGINPEVGHFIIRLAERDIAAAVRTPASRLPKRPVFNPSLN